MPADPELRIKAVVDASGARATLAELQQEAARGIRVGAGTVSGTFAGESSARGGVTTAGLAAPIAVGGIANNIFQSPVPQLPNEPPSMRLLQAAAFQERISNPQSLGSAGAAAASTGTPLEAVAPTISGGGGGGGNPFGYFGRAFFAIHELRELSTMNRGLERAQTAAAGASTRAGYFKAEAQRFGVLQQGLVSGTLSEIDNLIDPNYSPAAQQERAEALAEISERNAQNYGMFLSTANERDIRLARSGAGSTYRRNFNERLTRIRAGGETEQAQLRFKAGELDTNVQSVLDQAGGAANLRPGQRMLINSNVEQARVLRERAQAVGEDTVENVKKAAADEQFLQSMQSRGVGNELAVARLRTAGRTGLAGVVAAWGRGVQMIGAASRTGDEEVQRLTGEAAGQGVLESVGDLVRGGAGQIAAWSRRQSAAGSAARRDVLKTEELQAQQQVAELTANRLPVAAGITGILADTKQAVESLQTDNPKYTQQRDALRGIGVARLREFQNRLGDAAQAVEVVPGTLAPGGGRGSTLNGEDVGKQIAEAVKQAMGVGGNATGDAAGNVFQKIDRLANSLDRFISSVLGGG